MIQSLKAHNAIRIQKQSNFLLNVTNHMEGLHFPRKNTTCQRKKLPTTQAKS